MRCRRDSSNSNEAADRTLKGNSLRDLEAKTGVSHTALKRIADSSLQGYPDLEILKKIAEAYGQPLWHVLEMASLGLGLITRNQRLMTNVIPSRMRNSAKSARLRQHNTLTVGS